VICRDGMIVAESINKVTHDGDATRHADVAPISQAQKKLDNVSLEDCEIYMNVEPCALCVPKWNILGDTNICSAMPEVFAPPPEVISGYMAKEAEHALIEWNPLIAGIIIKRRLFGSAPRVITIVTQPPGLRGRVLRFLSRNFFDYFGQR
jgi:tRNA(adenine34) deaminase